MTIAAVALAWFSLWLLGAAASSAVGLRADAGVGTIAGDVGAGVVVLGTVGTFLVTAGGPLSIVPFYVLAGGLVATLRWRLPPVRPDWPDDRWIRVLLLGAAAACVAILAASTQDRLWWDGWATWAFKARMLFLDGSLPAGLLHADGPYAFAHADYPLAVPLLDWWQFRHAGRVQPALASFSGAVAFALLPLLTWSGLRGRVGDRIAAAATFGVAAFWPVAFYATGGTADVFIAVALLGAVTELERSVRRSDVRASWRLGVFLTLAALAKNEGIALAVVALVVAFAALARRRSCARRRVGIVPVLLPFVALAPWLAFRTVHDLGTDVIARGVPIGEMAARVPVLLAAVGEQFTGVAWMPLAVLVPMGVAAAVVRGRTGVRTAWALLGGYLAVLAAVYLRAPHSLDWLIATSLPRVLGVLVPAAAVLSVLSLFGRGEPARSPAPVEERHAAAA